MPILQPSPFLVAMMIVHFLPRFFQQCVCFKKQCFSGFPHLETLTLLLTPRSTYSPNPKPTTRTPRHSFPNLYYVIFTYRLNGTRLWKFHKHKLLLRVSSRTKNLTWMLGPSYSYFVSHIPVIQQSNVFSQKQTKNLTETFIICA